MYIADYTKDLSFAIDAVEEILNSKDGENFLSAIRQYKETREVDNNTLLRLKSYLR